MAPGLLIPPARFWLLLLVGTPVVSALPRWWCRLHRWELIEGLDHRVATEPAEHLTAATRATPGNAT